MAKSKMGQGQSRKLKAEYARDKTTLVTPEEQREIARRKGSSKTTRSQRPLNK
jgi:hypothetical protein